MEFTTWAVLATQAGALLMVCVITQLTKGLGAINKIPTQIWSWVIAIAVLYPAYYFTGQLDLGNAFLVPLNAAIVSLSANGGIEIVKRFTGGKEE